MTAEPHLALDRIQGIVVPGILKPQQALLLFQLDPVSRSAVAAELLRMLDMGLFSSGRETLEDRKRFRSGDALRDGLLRAIGLTGPGLDMLCHGLVATMPAPAFQAGMGERAGLLGDVDPRKWKVGGPLDLPYLLVLVAGNESDPVRREAQALVDRLAACGAKLRVPIEYGGTPKGLPRGHEHFGFADGISQPGIRGTWDGQHITRRHLPASDPEHDLFGRPGQHLVWPGEFVLGQPGASPDPRLPGPVREVPAWMHDGAFLVYRRLQQHVHDFRTTMAGEAARLGRLPGFAGMTDKRLAALLVGRWPSGAPLARAPLVDDPDLGAEPLLNNDFRFDDATPMRAFAAGTLAPPSAQADPLGLVCPLASHIRKVNLRDQASDVGGASATQSRRILRVGVPYGPALPPDAEQDDGVDRGLLFLSIQASIEDQFEFLQARWINSHARPRGPGGNDMVVGRGKRRCVLFGEGHAQAEVAFDQDFVTMTGGGYFFVPSLHTLRDLLQGTLPPD